MGWDPWSLRRSAGRVARPGAILPFVVLLLSGCDPDEGTPRPPISDLLATVEHEGPYLAGTSVWVSLEPTWDSTPSSEVHVTILAENGLVSVGESPGESGQVTIYPHGGELEDVRVTFPLDPWPYEVALRWRVEPMPDYAPVDGSAQRLEVVAPEIRETELVGTSGEHVMLPTGLAVEEYAQVGGAFDFGISEGADVELQSLALAFDDTVGTATMVVAGAAETCFFTPDLEPTCSQTRPEELEGEGPDHVDRVVFHTSYEEGTGLFLTAFCGDETSGGGLYSLGLDGTVERLVDLSNVRSLDSTGPRNHFWPEHPPGLYFFGRGDLRFWDPAAPGDDDDPCPSVSAYPDSVAIGSAEVYGVGQILFIEYDSGSGTAMLGRLTASCGLRTLPGEIVSTDQTPSLRPGPGAVFGHMAHLATSQGVQLVVPGATASEYSLFALAAAGEGATLHPVDLSRMPERTWYSEVHPPGLYVLDGNYEDARVLRIYQELD